jgi:hypothetical protein
MEASPDPHHDHAAGGPFTGPLGASGAPRRTADEACLDGLAWLRPEPDPPLLGDQVLSAVPLE